MNPDALDGFSKLVGRAAESAEKAVEYVGQHAQIEKGGGDLYDLVAGDHDQYVSEAKKALSKVRGVLDSSTKELAGSAKYYRATDQDEAAKLDATYPGSKAPAGASGETRTTSRTPATRARH